MAPSSLSAVVMVMRLAGPVASVAVGGGGRVSGSGSSVVGVSWVTVGALAVAVASVLVGRVV